MQRLLPDSGVYLHQKKMRITYHLHLERARRNSLSTGPYVEPSYKARQMYREFSKEKWVGDKDRGFRTFER